MNTELVFLGRDNVNELAVTEDGQPIDFTSATRMLLKFEGSGVVADSDVSSEFISWAADTITLKLGSLAIVPSKYPGTLIVFDADHPNGQVLFHARDTEVIFWFVPED